MWRRSSRGWDLPVLVIEDAFLANAALQRATAHGSGGGECWGS